MCLRYLPSTVNDVTVIEGKATLLNFILKDLSEELLMTGPPTTLLARVAYQSNEKILDDQKASTPEPSIQRPDFSHDSYSDLEVFLQQIRSVYSSLAQLYSIGQSVRGRELYVMKISYNVVMDEPGSPFEEICLCNISV